MNLPVSWNHLTGKIMIQTVCVEAYILCYKMSPLDDQCQPQNDLQSVCVEAYILCYKMSPLVDQCQPQNDQQYYIDVFVHNLIDCLCIWDKFLNKIQISKCLCNIMSFKSRDIAFKNIHRFNDFPLFGTYIYIAIYQSSLEYSYMTFYLSPRFMK